jgi:hypothetical protein
MEEDEEENEKILAKKLMFHRLIKVRLFCAPCTNKNA